MVSNLKKKKLISDIHFFDLKFYEQLFTIWYQNQYLYFSPGIYFYCDTVILCWMIFQKISSVTSTKKYIFMFIR